MMTRLDPRISQGAAVLAAGLAALLSWRWGYQPAVRAIMHDRERIATLTARLREVGSMVQTDGGAAPWLAHHEQRLAKLKARLPQPAQVPALLNALVDGLKVGDLRLLNVEQGRMEGARDGNQPILFQGLPCFQLPVTVTAEGRFQDVLAAMERLTGEAFPSAVSIEQVDLQPKDPASAKLGTTLKINLYVIGSPTPVPPNAS